MAVTQEEAALERQEPPSPVVGVDVFGNPVTAADVAPLTANGAPPEEGSAFEPSSPGEQLAYDENGGEMVVGGPAEPLVPEKQQRFYNEAEFAGSEWKIGILWRDTSEIDVTWFRCKPDGDSEWGYGFGSDGKWRVEDGAFITITRDFPLGWHGRRLFSARLGDDENYIEGVVRGWKPWEPASVMGRFQAIRLGVERPNPPPWLDDDEDEDDDSAAAALPSGDEDFAAATSDGAESSDGDAAAPDAADVSHGESAAADSAVGSTPPPSGGTPP